ncbi:hypothetical protein AZE42_13570 [Rhizopogon vesiculosus]|uniref:Uncharacterized protein n=1 Tax=Rhizopogon vesiculosus TaxID=180088 RepID=A0A1J8QSF1_9AGAM|nr:hypothetical protein AZE42_13570 [Rhizopogon vesiculosus]
MGIMMNDPTLPRSSWLLACVSPVTTAT